MKGKHTRNHQARPDVDAAVRVISVKADADLAYQKTLDFCQTSELPFWQHEKQLFVLMAALGCCLIRLFLTARHERLNLQPYLEDGGYRVADQYGERALNTAYGTVRYGRAYVHKKGHGFHPLDVILGLTRDKLSPWVMQWVARLATRMSFAAAQRVCKSVLNWAPATETIEQAVLGLGRKAAAFMQQLAAPEGDGDILVIEKDGKCPPTATAAELAKRRGKRRHKQGCSCGCQRHRGKAKRQARGSKKRRKKGDKSKNGREAIVLVMYTLKTSADGQRHGPINKKVWATFAGRKAAAAWARAEATKRGFGPDTDKTVQIVIDGAKGLRENLQRLFPKAIMTLDVCHVVEKLWEAGHLFHKEASEELKAWVADLKTLLYAGRIDELLERLQKHLEKVPSHGPGTKNRRTKLTKLINYISSRTSMMQYGDWIEQDLVIGSGQVEGAVRHVVGERLDCSGMRWVIGKAEPLLHLRCIELNGDWDSFVDWTKRHKPMQPTIRQRVKLLTDKPVNLKKVKYAKAA
jgi:hypothetical protein